MSHYDDPLKLENRDIAAILRALSRSCDDYQDEPARQLQARLDKYLMRYQGEQTTFFVVTEQGIMAAKLAVSAMHDTLDLENRLAQDEYRLHQLEARNQQNSEHIAYLRQMLEKLSKGKNEE